MEIKIMPMLRYETVVPDNGAITLPPEFRGTEIVVMKKITPPTEINNHWEYQKTLEELAEEQGDKHFTNPNRVFGTLSFLWDSQEEVEEFLQRRQQCKS